MILTDFFNDVYEYKTDYQYKKIMEITLNRNGMIIPNGIRHMKSYWLIFLIIQLIRYAKITESYTISNLLNKLNNPLKHI